MELTDVVKDILTHPAAITIGTYAACFIGVTIIRANDRVNFSLNIAGKPTYKGLSRPKAILKAAGRIMKEDYYTFGYSAVAAGTLVGLYYLIK